MTLMLVGSMVVSYSAIGLAAALGVSGGHEGRGEEDGGAHSCCVWELLFCCWDLLMSDDVCMYSDMLRVRVDVNANYVMR